MIIRKKELKDCESWVNINVSSWNDNLKGVVSDRLLEIITNNKESRIRRDILSFHASDADYVLEDNHKVLGILKIKQSERDGYQDCGEIQVLYLYTEEKGKGYGKALIYQTFKLLKDRGYKKVVIGCLDGNPANEFYQHMGGKFVRQDAWTIFDECYLENVYEYDLSKIFFESLCNKIE